MVEFSDPQCICLFSILPEFPFLRPRLLPSSPLSLFPFLPSFFPRVARLVCRSARRSFAPTSTLSLSSSISRFFDSKERAKAKKQRHTQLRQRESTSMQSEDLSLRIRCFVSSLQTWMDSSLLHQERRTWRRICFDIRYLDTIRLDWGQIL